MSQSNNTSAPRLLVVGAGGFIGGHIVAGALERGFDTWVAVRASTSRSRLDDERLHFVVLDYDNPGSMTETLATALPEGERWDMIIYNLGATKCINFTDFNRINYIYLKEFTKALRAADKLPRRFLYMSSLSALGPGDEKNYSPLTDLSIPSPNTRYGVSKIKAETYLETLPDLNWTIFRPTGVYGPYEKDYLMMIKSIDSHFDFGVGMRRQMLTFIYVTDLVNAMFDALATDATIKRKYIISEDRAYSQREFRKMVARALGSKWVIPVKLPLWMAYVASAMAERIGTLRGKPSTLNRDKYKIMRQRNWNCDVSRAKADFNFTVRYPLEKGVQHTVEAYLEAKKGARQ
ncbi:MAG: NAD(P)-dependent oxidoreductase [Muribaculaceae bacterium]|nr:NAD(P)-dependent oxidoreductase [Muribaculaceae bacterium]